MPTVKIVHIRDYPQSWYIGRTDSVRPATGNPLARGFWGNPFLVAHGNTRKQAVAQHMRWARQTTAIMENLLVLVRPELMDTETGVVLWGCFCKTEHAPDTLCHGDNLLVLCREAGLI